MIPLITAAPERLEPYEGKKRRQPNIILTLLLYTVLAVIMAAGVYFLLYDQQRTLVHYGAVNKDAFSQRYMFIFEFQRFIQNLFKGATINTWDWSIGLGADGYAFNLANLVNPLNYITLYHPEKYADITYSISILLRMYFAGFFFIFFARKLGLSGVQVMAGALLYAFSPWNVVASMSQGTFTIASMLLPPVMLGVEKITRGESPLLFMLSVGYSVVAAFSIAYMIALITLLYYAVRYFTSEYIERSVLGFIKTTLAFLITGATGIALSGFGLYVTLLKFGNSTSATGRAVPTHFGLTQYLRFPLRLMDFNTFFGSNSVIAVSAIGIVMIPVIIYLFFRRRTNAVMTAILLVFSLIPFVNSAFNFFSYVSGRWMFALALFYTLAAVECLDAGILRNRKIRISIIASFALYTVYLAWIQKILSDTGKQVLLINWLTCLILITMIEVVFVLWGSLFDGRKVMAAAETQAGNETDAEPALAEAELTEADAAANGVGTEPAEADAATEKAEIDMSAEVAAALADADESADKEVTEEPAPVEEVVPKKPGAAGSAPIGKAGRILFGGLSIAMVVVSCLGLTAAYNVKYEKSMKGFLPVGKAAEKISRSSQRIGPHIDDNDFYRIDQLGDLLGTWAPHCKVNEAIYYGNRSNYVFYSSVDSDWLRYNKLLGNNLGYYKRVAPNSNDNRFGLDLLQGTKYFIGNDENAIAEASYYAGHSFEKCMDYEGIELLQNKYNIGIGCLFTRYISEAEWMKLNYAERELAMLEAVVIADGQTPPSGLKEMKASDFNGIVKKLKRKVKENGWEVDIKAENDGKHQVLLSFENIHSSVNGRMTLTAQNSILTKSVINTIGDNRGFSDIKDLTVNMGWRKDALDDVKVTFTPNGSHPDDVSFIYDDVVLYSTPLDEYDMRAQQLVNRRLKTESFAGDYFRGTVTCEQDSLLYLSVPDDKGWEVFVDGRKVKKRDAVDIAFTGVDLSSGRHTVELKYHTYGFWQGCVVTLVGFVIMVIIMSIYNNVIYSGKEDEE
ncbi:MAG: YfhO family protein [Eubacterium sp.]|nr:YfhO family protein [Eubacterium sp.]